MNSSTLNLQTEFRALEDRLRADGRSACAELRHIPNGTYDLLARELRSFCPNVLHFAGHATKDTLLFEGNRRQRVDLPTSALGPLLQRLTPQLRCLVLSACNTAAQADTLLANVPCFLGMRDAILDDTAIRCCTGFYSALAFGEPLGMAFAAARDEVYGTSSADPQVPGFFFRPKVDTLPLIRKLRIFCLYTKEDKAAYTDLGKSLAVYRRAGMIELFGALDAPPSANRQRYCEDAMDQANIILCLSSDDFLADDFCVELIQRALRRREIGQAAVINLLVGHCAWQDTPLGHLQPLPRNEVPLNGTRKDGWWLDVVTDLREVLKTEEARVLYKLWETTMKNSSAPKPAASESPAPAVPKPDNTQTAEPVTQAPSQPLDQGEMVDKLSELTPAQFERILLELEVQIAVLSPPTVAQMTRAIELVRFLKAQRTAGLLTLSEVLKKLSPL